MHNSIVGNDIKQLEILVKGAKKNDFEKRDEKGRTPLMLATELNRIEIASALMEAVVLTVGGKKYVEIIRLLIQGGADVNILDKNGVTALQHARKKGFKEIEKLLVQSGAK